MNKTTHILLLVFLSITSFSALASTTEKAINDVCLTKAGDHTLYVEESNKFIASLSEHSKTITAFEITQLQKNLTERYKSLKELLALYEGVCAPKALATAIAIYDFSSMGEDVFKNTELRRVVKGFKQYPAFGLSDYIEKYEYYTSAAVVEETKALIEKDNVEKAMDYIQTFNGFENSYDPDLHKTSDTAINGAGTVVANAARIWGFISDHLKWRSGRLNENKVIQQFVETKLKPLDLLYEKRTFVLSNYTIPGHWGHVGIWLGTKEELISLKIWDQDYFKPYQKYVLEGKQIVEIRKKGANFQGLDTFLNLDEFAITRFSDIQGNAEVVYKEIFSQLEKEYDFKFDARTADKITCAELISFSYGDIKWPESKALFQVTLRPDDIARMTLDKNSGEELILYLKGNKKAAPSFLNFEDWKKVFETKKEKKEAKKEAKAKAKKEDTSPSFEELYGRG